jgi:peptidoglycan hydrolase-like protein with peptidoglycan-binding domain
MKKLSIRALLALAPLALTCSLSVNASPSPAAPALKPRQSSASVPAASPQSSATSTKKKKTKHHSSKREPTQKAPTPDRISEIQSALARGGYYQGQPNGKWDSNTVAALQKFQSDNGMNASGKLDALSLQKLGLGSSTAGVDAPKPVSHTSSNANTASSAPAPTANSATSASAVPVSTGTSSANSSSAAKPPQH